MIYNNNNNNIFTNTKQDEEARNRIVKILNDKEIQRIIRIMIHRRIMITELDQDNRFFF